MKWIRILTAATLMVAAQAQNPYYGAVPDAQAGKGSLSLTLSETIRLALKNNLGTLLADENTMAARGQRVVAMSQLLPHLDARIARSSQQVNLAAFGFSAFPGINSIIGPFSIFDARMSVSQSVLNFQTLNASRAGAENVRAAGMEYQDARDTVVLVATALYLDATAGASRIDAAKARVSAAQALYGQAVNFKASGVVAGIDVLRADVQLRGQKQRLIAYQNEFEKQKLRLARAIGLPDGGALRLADPMPASSSVTVPTVEQAVEMALESRMDYRSLQSRLKAAEFNRKAASAGRLPTIGFNADYGTIGKAPDNSHGTFSAAVAVRVPVFDGHRVKGEEMEADAARARIQAQAADLRARIEFEIRSAQLDLHAASDQLDVARGTVELARRQQQQAQDRFAAGVTNNLEAVQAQEALAQADENLISSLLAGNLAKAALARSIGASEKNIPAFLLGAK
ncbi:MAG TPA: TolC family protein [Paludibaculum sp.]|jgi:outer membrane protein TolC